MYVYCIFIPSFFVLLSLYFRVFKIIVCPFSVVHSIVSFDLQLLIIALWYLQTFINPFHFFCVHGETHVHKNGASCVNSDTYT